MGVFSDFAYSYNELGYIVCPVNERKECRIPDRRQIWSQSGQTPDDLDWIIHSFLEKNPDHQQGIGIVSANRVLCFDFDWYHDGAKWFEEEVKKIIPPSPVHRFGSKGFACFYKYTSPRGAVPPPIKRGGKVFCEFISGAKYIVIPPTKNGPSSKYKWLTPDNLLDYRAEDLPEFDWSVIEDLILLAMSREFPLPENSSAGIIGPAGDGRNGYFVRLAFSLFNSGIKPGRPIVEDFISRDRELWPQPLFSDPSEFPSSFRTPDKSAEKFINSVFKTFINNRGRK